jgi:hypothetical protein
LILMLVAQTGGHAQEKPKYDIFDVLLESMEEIFNPDLAGLRLLFESEQTEPRVVADPQGDFQHSLGFEPGFTPGHLDMRQIVKTGVIHPTDDTMAFFADGANGGPWCNRNRFGTNMRMFSACPPGYDGKGEAFSEGALVVGVSLADRIPTRPPARHEYVVWTLRPEAGEVFQESPIFPNDPARGTNGAIGVVFVPGQGWRPFALVLTDQGSFEPADTNTVVAIYESQIILFIPLSEIEGVRSVRYYSFGLRQGNNPLNQQDSGGDETDLIPLRLGALPVANLSLEQPAPGETDEPPVVSTEPTGSGALRQFFVFVIVIGGLVIVGGFYVFWTTRERRRPGTTEVPGETPGTGETPGGTPDSGSGWIQEYPPACDWAAYYVPGKGPDVVIRAATGKECCVYRVKLLTHVYEHEEVTRERQDGPPREGELARRTLQMADIVPLGVDAWVEASSRSGPEGSQEWMQGLGDLPDRARPSDIPPQPWPGGSTTPDSSAHASMHEMTSLSVTLESDCPGHQNTFEATGSSDITIGAHQECTNGADGGCPVELTASGTATVEVNGAVAYRIGHQAGGDPNELEAAVGEPSAGDAPRAFHAITDLHDHEELDRSDYVGGDDTSSSAQYVGDSLGIDVHNTAELDAGSLVPTNVWPSTDRVTARIEASLRHSFDVSADMKRTECIDGPCCGGLPCSCEPSLTVHLAGGSAEIIAGGNTVTVTRPGAALVGQDHAWETA